MEPWFAGHAYSALGNLAFEQGDWLAASEASTMAARAFPVAGLRPERRVGRRDFGVHAGLGHAAT